MRKPVEAIERVREWSLCGPDISAIFAYLDSVKEWPADLTRERLIALYNKYKNPYPVKFDRPIPYDEELADALLRLAELAPKREKRKVEIWETPERELRVLWMAPPRDFKIAPGWRKVGEAEIDA